MIRCSSKLDEQGMHSGINITRFFCYCCSVVQSCLTLCDPTDCSTLGFPVLHHLPELAQTPVHWVGDAVQPSRSLSSPLLLLSIYPVSLLFTLRGQSIRPSKSLQTRKIQNLFFLCVHEKHGGTWARGAVERHTPSLCLFGWYLCRGWDTWLT